MVINRVDRINCQYTNFFGNKEQFDLELKNSSIHRNELCGYCWATLKNSIYYINYAVDDVAILCRFIENEVAQICDNNGFLLELKFSNLAFVKEYDLLINTLENCGFSKKSHHTAYLKSYFKVAGDTDGVDFVTTKDCDKLLNLLAQIPLLRRNLTEELLSSFIDNPEYSVIADKFGGRFRGFIVINYGGNLEHLGFIREIYLDSGLSYDEQFNIGCNLFNFALNTLAAKGVDKAVFWNEIKDVETDQLLRKYGFIKYGTEIILYYRQNGEK